MARWEFDPKTRRTKSVLYRYRYDRGMLSDPHIDATAGDSLYSYTMGGPGCLERFEKERAGEETDQDFKCQQQQQQEPLESESPEEEGVNQSAEDKEEENSIEEYGDNAHFLVRTNS
jgi:hypothetical protein